MVAPGPGRDNMKRILQCRGTIAADRPRRVHGLRDANITVVDQDDAHLYQPGLLFAPSGLAVA